MENFVVTGATGHIGNTLVRELSKIDDAKIKLLILPDEDVSVFNDLNVEIKFGNILDINFLKREINENDVVFHLAGIIDISSAKKDMVYKVNVEGTKNIASVCLEKKVKKFIYTSSVHVIPPLKKGVLLGEPEIFNEKIIIGDYAKSKTLAVKIVFNLVKSGLNAVVTYPAGVIGPNDYKVSEMGTLILDISNKKISNRISGGYNFVDVRDVAQGLISAYKNGRIGEGYILSGHMVSIDDLFKIVNKKFGRTKLVPKIARWFVKMFAKLAELHYKIRKRKPLFTSYSLYTISSNHNFSNQKAKKELQFNPRSIESSIFDAIDWFVENKKELFNAKVLEEYYSIQQVQKNNKNSTI